MARGSIRDDILFGGDPVATDLDVESGGKEEDRAKGSNRWAEDRAFGDSAYDGRVIARELHPAIRPFFMPENHSMQKRKHLLPVDVFVAVTCRDTRRE